MTARLFQEDGEEIAPGTDPSDMGLAYRRDGGLPHPVLRTTDQSGTFAAANVPAPSDGHVNLVTYGTLREGADRRVIGCEQVSVAAGIVTIVGVGPLRSDYPVGTFCATVSSE